MKILASVLVAWVAAAPLVAQAHRDSAPITAGVWAPAGSIGSTRRGIDTSDFDRGARPRTLSELLQARAAGVSVLRHGGGPTDGSRVRVRGPAGSVSNAAPLLVVDGVHVLAPERIGQAFQASRFDDFEPEEIERVDILSGPAATTAYGNQASNGAILITTHRGRTGAPQLRSWAEAGAARERSAYPSNFFQSGVTTDAQGRCDVFVRAAGTCTTTTTLAEWNPLKAASPFEQGRTRAAGASISGGPFGVAAYGSLSRRSEAGVIGGDASRSNARVNMERAFFGRVRVAARAGYVERRATTADDDPVRWGVTGTAFDDANRGYRIPFFEAVPTDRSADRLTRSALIDARLLPWLSLHGAFGRDETTQEDGRTFPATPSGFPSTSDVNTFWSGSSASQASLDATHRVRTIELRSILSWEESRGIERQRRELISGTVFSSEEMWRTHRVRTVMLQERARFGERLFANVGVRRMATTRTGKPRWHPSIDVSWLAGEVGPLRAMRVRGAFAHGMGARDTAVAIIFIPPFGSPVPGPQPDEPDELELGGAASLGTRADFDVVWFSNSNRHGWVPGGPPAPSVGGLPAQSSPRRSSLSSSGVEITANVDVVRRSWLNLTGEVALAMLSTKTEKNGFPPLRSPGGFGLVPGEAYGVAIAQDITFVDADGDGLPDGGELTFSQVPHVVGVTLPTREASLRLSLALPRSGVSLGAALDHRGGHRAVDWAGETNCRGPSMACRALQDPAVPIDDVVRAVGVRLVQAPSLWDGASYTRVSELALRWRPGKSLPSALRGATLSVVGRNLLTLTDFAGTDPEIATASTGLASVSPTHGLPRTIALGLSYDVR